MYNMTRKCGTIMSQVGVLFFLVGVIGPLCMELAMGEGLTARWYILTWHLVADVGVEPC